MIAHLAKLVRLYWRLLLDIRVPWLPKIVLMLAMTYALSPIDLLPDWALPLVGYADDLIILIFALQYFIAKCPQLVIDEHISAIEQAR